MFDIRMYALEWYIPTIYVLPEVCYLLHISHLQSSFVLLTLQSFSCNEQLLYILSRPLLIYHVDFLHDSRIKYSKMAADVFFTYFSIRTYDVVVTNYTIFDLSSRLNHITVTYLSIKDIAFNTEHIVAAYLHNIVLLGSGLKHNNCPLFNHIIISKNDLEVFLLSLADDRTRRVDDTSLTKDNIADYLVESKI